MDDKFNFLNSFISYMSNSLKQTEESKETLIGAIKPQVLKEINEFSKNFKKALELSDGVKFMVEETLIAGTIDITAEYDRLYFDESHLKIFSKLFTDYYVGVANDWDFFRTGIKKPQLSFSFYNCFNMDVVKERDVLQ